MAKKERRWLSPNTRAKRYSEELKNKVHMYGPKEGQPLTDKEACVILVKSLLPFLVTA